MREEIYKARDLLAQRESEISMDLKDGKELYELAIEVISKGRPISDAIPSLDRQLEIYVYMKHSLKTPYAKVRVGNTLKSVTLDAFEIRDRWLRREQNNICWNKEMKQK